MSGGNRRQSWAVLAGFCTLLLVACGNDGGSDPSGNDPVRLVAVGDIACPPDETPTPVTCQQDATADLTSSLDPDQVIALGDLQYEAGAEDDFRAAYEQSWGRFDDILHSVPGNHEYGTEDAAGYDAYVGQEDPTDPDYYAWDAGAWRIYMLDTNCEAIDCAAEQDWFSADLAAHPTKCSAMAMHHPRFSSGAHHSDDTLQPFWEVAYAADLDLALAGHDHDYERFARLDPEGEASSHGITSFVVGTGGRSLYHQGSLVDGSQFFQATEFGVLEVTLRPTAAAWRYLTVDHEVLDEGSVACA